jgi:hypothetical protein
MFEPKLIGRAPFDGVQLLHRESRLEPSSPPEKRQNRMHKTFAEQDRSKKIFHYV